MSYDGPVFHVYADRMGEWRFRFTCEAGQNRLRASEGYNAKASAIKAIDSVRRNAPDVKRYDFKENSRGKHFFTLKARNGNILAVSRNFAERDALDADLSIIQAQVAAASVVEE